MLQDCFYVPYGSTYNHSWGNHTNSSWEPRPPQYAPPKPPYYASTLESPQPPQSISPFEQAILDLTRIVDDFVAENKGINAHSNQRIVTVEDNLNKKLDRLKMTLSKNGTTCKTPLKTSSINSNVHQRRSAKVTPW